MRFSRRNRHAAALLSAAVAITAPQLQAAVQYWDPNGATPGAGATPTGNWNTTAGNLVWSTDATGSIASTIWTNNNDAVFSAGTDAVNPFTVTLTTAITANSILLEEGTLTLAGTSLLTMVIGGNITNNTANTLTINTPINQSAAGNFTITGSGNIVLGGATGNGTATAPAEIYTGTGTLTLSGAADNNANNLTVDTPTGLVILGKTSSATVHATGGGGLTITAGTVRLGGNGGDQMFNNGPFNNNGGTFDMNGQSETVNIFSGTGTGAIVTNSTASGSATLSVGFNNGSGTYAGVVQNGPTATLAFTKLGTGTQTFTGTNTYTGPTVISGGLVLSGAAGAITASPTFTFNSGSTFLIDNSVDNNNNRLLDTAAITFNGTAFTYNGSAAAATNSTETIGSIALGGGSSTLTIAFGGTNTAIVTAGSLTRTSPAIALVNGAGLGMDSASAASVSRLILTSAPTLVGTSDALATGINAAAKDTKIVPFLVGESDTAPAGVGTQTGVANTFVTYNATTGLRPLNPTSEFVADAFTAGANIRIANASSTSGNVSINSLVIAGGDVSIQDGTALTNTSGALLFTTSNAILPSASTGALAFAAEPIITVTTGVTGVIGAPITTSATLIKGGPGTLALTNDNTGFTSPVTIVSGTLQLGTGGTTGGIGASPGVTLAGGTLAFNRSDNSTFNIPITGNGNVLKTGTGTVTIGTTNTYTGTTTIASGTLTVGALNAISPSSALVLGAGTTAGNLNVAAANQSVTSLTIQSNSTTATNTITIPAGLTLTITGTPTNAAAVTVGETVTPGATTLAAINGAGSLIVNNTATNTFVMTSPENTVATTQVLNMTGLATLNVTVTTFAVGDGTGRPNSQMTLADNTTITATTFRYANSSGSGTSGSFLRLGQTNVINANTITIANARTSSNLSFRAGLTGTPTLKVRAQNTTGRADFVLGNNSTTFTAVGGGSSAPTCVADLTPGSVDLLLNNLVLGICGAVASALAGHGVGTLTFDEGTVDATTVVLGRAVSSGTAGTDTNASTHGTLNVQGGTFLAGSIAIAQNQDATAGINFAIKGAQHLRRNLHDHRRHQPRQPLLHQHRQLHRRGVVYRRRHQRRRQHHRGNRRHRPEHPHPRRRRPGHDGGHDQRRHLQPPQRHAPQRPPVQLQRRHRRSITKTAGAGTNTLTLAGVNAYTGATTVSAGTFLVNGSITATASVTVSGGSILGGTGSIKPTGAAAGNNISVDATSTLSPGAGGVGTLTVDSAGTTAASVLALASGAKLAMDLNTGFQSDKIQLTGGAANDISFGGNVVNFTDLSAGALPGGVYTLVTSDVAGAYSGLTLDGSNNITAGLTIGTGLEAYPGSTLQVAGNDIVLNLVPEPTSIGIIGIAPVGLLARRRRRA